MKNNIPPEWPSSIRALVAVGITRLFDDWRLIESDRLVLLGLEANEADLLKGFWRGKHLPDRPKVYAHLGYLTSMARKLPELYPGQMRVADAWISLASEAFGGLSPLEVARREGLEGLHKLDRHLRRRRRRS